MSQRKRELELDIKATTQDWEVASAASKEARNRVLMAKSRAYTAGDNEKAAYDAMKASKKALNMYLNN